MRFSYGMRRPGSGSCIRLVEPRLERAVQLPIYSLQVNTLQSFCKIIRSQFRQRNFKYLHDPSISVFNRTASIACSAWLAE